MNRALLFAVAAFIFLPSAVSAATGDLIKSADSPAVYYQGAEDKRYAFPNEDTYATWYADFSSVKTVSAEGLAALMLAGNVTYRPGARMVKIVSDPKTYAVDRGGTLRWIKTEEVAAALYGSDWNTKIDDVPDAFFVNYRVGAPVEDASDFDPDAAMSASPDIASDKAYGALTAFNDPKAAGVSLASEAKARIVIQGAKAYDLAAFTFTAPAGAASVITSASFQGYIDEAEGDADFGAGSDEDNVSPTYLRAHVPAVTLYDASGTRLAGPIDVPISGKVRLDGFAVQIPAGESRTLTLKGDIVKGLDMEGASDVIAFDYVDASTEAPGPNGGATPKATIVIKASGKLAVTWSGNAGAIIAGRVSEVGTLTFEATDDTYEIRTVSMALIGQVKSVAKISLDAPKAGGGVAMAAASNENLFGGLALAVPAGQKISVRVLAELYSRSGGAVSGEKIKVDLLKTLPFEAVSKTTFDALRESAWGTAALSHLSTVSDLDVRYSTLTVAKLADTPSGEIARTSETPVLRFSLTAAPDGPVRVAKLSFKITPSDAGTENPDNDLLEKWADVNGDFFDDNSIVNLRKPANAGGEIIGEDAQATIAFSIVHATTEDTTPQGYDTAAGDYGLIRYIFSEGSELTILAGATFTFQLEVAVDRMFASPQTLSAELLGGNDLQWVDTGVGSYPATLSGSAATGLPVASGTLSVP